MDIDQQRAVLTLCLMAAFADGAHSDQERAEIKRIAGALGADSALDAAAIYEDVLLDQEARALTERGPGDIAKLLTSGDTWKISSEGG